MDDRRSHRRPVMTRVRLKIINNSKVSISIKLAQLIEMLFDEKIATDIIQ
jgi:hypothetical protein